MKENRVKSALLALLLALTAPLTAANVQMLDRVAAIVDDDIILASELEQRLEQVRGNLQRAGQQMPEEQLRREVLDRMIVENLQLQMAERAGLRIDDEQLNAAMSRIASQNNMNLPEFRRAMEMSGQSYEEAREQIRREMIMQQVQRGSVSQRIQVTAQEIDNFLESEEGREYTSPEYRLAHLLVPVSSSASSEAIARAEQRAEELARQLRQGAEMDSLRRGEIQGGDLGWRKADQLPTLFSDLPQRLDQGDVSEPLRSGSGFHVAKMVDSRGHREVITQTRARHILVSPSAIRDEQQTIALAEQLRERAREGESFTELARRFSEDIGSAQEGGDLGWVNPGQMVAEFENAMNQTEPGELSEPVQTQFGWHIIKVEDRRQQDVTREMRRRMARNVLQERKFEDELEVWLRNLRDEAFVDIKI